jgi:hypothetical protein
MPKPTSPPTVFTGKQKLALSLERAGFHHAEIAKKMGLRHRQAATQLLARARRAEKALEASLMEFLGKAAPRDLKRRG